MAENIGIGKISHSLKQCRLLGTFDGKIGKKIVCQQHSVEINELFSNSDFGVSKSAKTAIFAFLEALNFD